jgi:hypothetical protein
MLKLMKNRKAVAPLFVFLIIILILIAVYITLFIPIPAFQKLRMIINYFLIIILWVVLQAGLIYVYFRIGTYSTKGFNTMRGLVTRGTFKMRHFIIIHS